MNEVWHYLSAEEEEQRYLAERNKEFFVAIRNGFGIDRIYYPGCGIDRELYMSFSPEEIVALDKVGLQINQVKGDYTKPPFRNRTFDAVYIKDLHIQDNPEDLNEILYVVKIGGVLIYNKDCRTNALISTTDGDLFDADKRLRAIQELPKNYFMTAYELVA